MTKSPGTPALGDPLYLVPVDFAECSRRALVWADERARSVHARLHVVHLLPWTLAFPTVQPAMLTMSPQLYEDQTASAEQALEGFVQACRSPHTTQVLQGDVVQGIVELSQRLQPDLLVMGSHGRNGVERLVLGSVSEAVLRKVRCPVILVPQRAPLAS